MRSSCPTCVWLSVCPIVHCELMPCRTDLDSGARCRACSLSLPMSGLQCANNDVQSGLEGLYAGLKVQTCTPSMRWLHTEMRDRRTSHASFVQCSDRLLRLLIEEALSTLPFQEVDVVTPTGHTFKGLQLQQQQQPIAVSVLRAVHRLPPCPCGCGSTLLCRARVWRLLSDKCYEMCASVRSSSKGTKHCRAR